MTSPGMRRIDIDAEAARLAEDRKRATGGFERDDAVPLCAVPGGHCWERTGTVLASDPPQYPERCKHCPARRVAIPREPFEYGYVR